MKLGKGCKHREVQVEVSLQPSASVTIQVNNLRLESPWLEALLTALRSWLLLLLMCWEGRWLSVDTT